MLRDELNQMFHNFSIDTELLNLSISGQWIRGYYGNETSYKKLETNSSLLMFYKIILFASSNTNPSFFNGFWRIHTEKK